MSIQVCLTCMSTYRKAQGSLYCPLLVFKQEQRLDTIDIIICKISSIKIKIQGWKNCFSVQITFCFFRHLCSDPSNHVRWVPKFSISACRGSDTSGHCRHLHSCVYDPLATQIFKNKWITLKKKRKSMKKPGYSHSGVLSPHLE